MKTKKSRLFTFIIFLLTTQGYSINTLTVQDPTIYGSKPGFIDQATLIIEPHGGFTEQSLYLKYSDHQQYPGKDKIEIVHRFELPQGAVINDLWLWIGDSVMQAIMMDTWTARAIYDSIVDIKRDPAFLTKKGNQYELHIYPLKSGDFRKIKMNYIIPTSWRGNQATSTLPFGLLNSSNSTTKSLDILFRTQENVWGQPFIVEQADLEFESLIDTAGYFFKHCRIPDISSFSYLNIKYQTDFQNGYFFKSNQIKNDPSFFQIGIYPKEFFNLKSDSTSKKYIIGLDLCGLYNKKFSFIIPKIKSVLESCLTGEDYFQLLVVGAGQYQKVTDVWLDGTTSSITAALTQFEQSNLGTTINSQKLPHIIYCDNHAATCWKFPDIEKIATFEQYSNLKSALNHLSQSDIIAAYDHGHESPLDNETLQLVTTSLEPFFSNGGRF